MKEETRIIIKNKLLKKSKDALTDKLSRMAFILGARQLLLLLSQYEVLDLSETESLFEDLDIGNIKL